MKKVTKSRTGNKVNKLLPIMEEHFGQSMNLARIKLMAFMLEALCIVQTVCLHKIAAAMPTAASRDSNFRRLQRFLAAKALDFDMVARVIFALLPQKSGLVLSMDRTNWKYGDFNINILMLGVTYKGIAFPLMFSLLPKRGNSNHAERIALIERFVKLFGKDCIDCLVADREFVGKEWIGWLNSRSIRYYIRIKQNFHVVKPSDKSVIRVSWLFNRLALGQELFLWKPYLLKGEYVYLAGARLKNSEGMPELQILVSYNRPAEAVATYRRRWEIETCFKAMKSSGFDMEKTHLRDLQRVARLVAMVCIAVVWAYLVGDHKDTKVKAIRTLKHGRLAKSRVKYGIEEIADVLLRPQRPPQFDIFQFLSCS